MTMLPRPLLQVSLFVLFAGLLAGPAVPARAQDQKKKDAKLADYFGFQPLEIYKLEHRIGNLMLKDLDGDKVDDILISNNGRSRIDLLLSTKKPDDDQPKTPAVQTAPSNASVAAEATAMPNPHTAQEALRSTAPDLGTGESLRRMRTTWQKELAVHLNKYKRYPEDRTTGGAQVVVSFVLDRVGHVLSSRVVTGSGDQAFDDAALAMLERANPVPPPPPQSP